MYHHVRVLLVRPLSFVAAGHFDSFAPSVFFGGGETSRSQTASPHTTPCRHVIGPLRPIIICTTYSGFFADLHSVGVCSPQEYQVPCTRLS
ncbi:hypothetical protein PF010_g13653 [Phytophthora fragariae]|uniref:Secreted protein n=1 Tax=Phytophthora fragariae TaxID=53985 RepID=A0A6G0NT90_9STRA|nr:hypothetical protein PF010_g13653 [Phytophthora fragariae]KAE9221445.1 hypothetical protein PF004_g13051 [Phytophthora fragariae]